jgi:hypothetical protein
VFEIEILVRRNIAEYVQIAPFHKMMTFTPSLHRGGFCFFARCSFAL